MPLCQATVCAYCKAIKQQQKTLKVDLTYALRHLANTLHFAKQFQWDAGQVQEMFTCYIKSSIEPTVLSLV